jgi:hypothetical protein
MLFMSQDKNQGYRHLAEKFARFVEFHGIETLTGQAHRVAKTKFQADGTPKVPPKLDDSF